jgi:hypothetical protein
MWQAIAGGVSGIIGPFVGYFQRRAELRLAEHQARLAVVIAQGERQATLAMAGLAADQQWEASMAEQAASGWKDEYVLGLISVPLAMCFVRTSSFDGPQIVADGFAALGGTPLWYQSVVVAVLLATYGIRAWRRSQYDTDNPVQSASAIKAALEGKRK